MIEILGEGTRIHKILPPDTTDFNDEAYSAAVLKEIGEDRDIESIRQDYINRATSDIEEATASNLLNGAPADKVIPIHMRSMALVEQYYKDKKAYEIANEAASEKSFEQHLMDNPQALLNYANSGELDVDSIRDSRILNFQYEISKTIDKDDFVFDLVARTGADFATTIAGRALKKAPNPIARGAGYVLDTYGFGNAKDYVLLGGRTISETGMLLREKYLEILDKDSSDDDFKKDVEGFIQELKKIPAPYRPEQIDYILSDVSPYADAGGAGLAYGMKTGFSTFRTLKYLKGLSRYFGNSKKNTINDGLMKEMDDLTTEQASTTATADTAKTTDTVGAARTIDTVGTADTAKTIDTTGTTATARTIDTVATTGTVGTADTVGTNPFAEYLSVEERLAKIARDIDERKSKGAVVLYNNHPVQVVTPLPTVKVFEPEILPNTDVVPYTPKALEGPVKTIPSPGTVKQLDYGTVFEDAGYGLEKETDWENRRITFTDDNRGRGYTLNEAIEAVREYEQVSAAATTPYTRAASTLATADKGAGGAHYGKGPYASIDNLEHNDPASFGHYRVGLEKEKFYDEVQNINEIERFVDPDFNEIEKLAEYLKLDANKVFKDVHDTLHDTYKHAYLDNPQGMADYYTAFKELKKNLNWWNTAKLNPVVREDHDKIVTLLAEKYVDNMLEKYKGFKSGVMNYWYGAVPESQIGHWIDERDHSHIYFGQNVEVRKKLDNYNKKVMSAVEDIFDVNPISASKNSIFRMLFGDELELDFMSQLKHSSDIKNINHLSDQYPLFIRLAMDEIPDEEWIDFLKDPANISFHVYNKKVNMMKRLLSHNGQEIQRKMLVKEGIWGDVHSDVNVVFFKQTPAQMSNVFKQTWTEDGYYYTKLLDNGAFPLYDPKLQAYVIKVSEVVPGRGRKPVLLSRQKIKKMKLKE